MSIITFNLRDNMKKAIQIDAKDNVATVTSNISAGDYVDVLSPEGAIVKKLKTSETIPFGHKIALVNINISNKVIKYGEIIGIAYQPIKVGDWVHVHNVKSATVPTSDFERVVR